MEGTSTKFSKGALVWVRHPTEAWKPGTVGEVLQKGRVRIFYADGKEDVVRTSKDNPLLRTISCEGDIQLSGGGKTGDAAELFSDDLTKMTQLITPAVLHSLMKSYEQGRFYSKLGSGTVLALNPFKEAPELFTLKAIQMYHSVTLTQLQDLPAHVYAAAQSALVSLRASVGRVNQSIIVSGESGAGKTWTVRCLMRYLAEVGIEYKRRLSSTEDPVSSAHVTPIRASMKHSIHDVIHHSNSEARPQIKAPQDIATKLKTTNNNNINNVVGDCLSSAAMETNGCHGDPTSIPTLSEEESLNLNINNNKETDQLVGPCSGAGDGPRVNNIKGGDNLNMALDFNEERDSTEDEETMEDEENDVLADMDETVEDLNTSIRIVDRIERRILHSNPILEAFGNAHTLRNENSSRFGKYIQLQYDRSGTIVGAQLRTYLLEKTRAVRHDPGERSYHIFYQMLHGAREDERIAWKLPDCPFPEDGNKADEEFKRKQKSDFIETRTSMLRIGILDETQKQIFKLLSAVLHLRQLTFEGSDDLQNPCVLEEENPLNKESLKIAAELLGVAEETIMKVITLREITAHSNRRKSVFHRPSTVEECYSRRDSIVKLIYEILFHWIVQRVGDSVSAPKDMWYSFIGLLDVYGFESFENNSLEQLCINYANEKLQQHFVSSFLREQQEEYSLEGVSWTQCDLTDNVECLLALEAPRNSLFSLLNEECRLNRARAENQLKSRVEIMFRGSKYIVQPRISTQAPSFSVVHYAGQVSYRTEDLIEKNKDEVPIEITQLLASSQNRFVHSISNDRKSDGDDNEVFGSGQEDTVMLQNKGKHRPTVLTRFKKSLDDLLETLASTDCHYIRCIKPNKQSVPEVFDAQFVLNQLESCGVVETIRVCAPAHPNKLSYNEFLGRYGFLLRKDEDDFSQTVQDTPKEPSKKKRRRSMTNVDLRKDACERIMKALKKTSKVWTEIEKDPLQYGRTKIFLSSDLFEALEASRSDEIVKCTCVVQRTWRAFALRKKCRAERKAIISKRENAASVVQRAWKLMINQRKCRAERKALIAKQHQKATLLQRCWTNHKRIAEARKQRKIMIKKRDYAALQIQSTFRGWRIRYKYKDLLDAWKQLKLLPEPEYRKMIERRLRLLVGPEPAISPSPSYEAIRATFEMPEVSVRNGHLTTPGTPSSVASLAPSSTSTPLSVHGASPGEKNNNNNTEKLTVYYDNTTPKKIIVKETVIQDDLEPSDNDLHRLLHSQGADISMPHRNHQSVTSTPNRTGVFSPGASSSSIHDSFASEGNSPMHDDIYTGMTKWKSEDDVIMSHHHLRSSSKTMRHAKIVHSSSSLDRVAEKIEVQRSTSLPKFPTGPGIIYAWHNRATISAMTPKRPLSLSSDPLTMLEMQYNESASVVTTPLSNLRLSKRSHRRKIKHRHSNRNGHFTPPRLDTYSFTWSPRQSGIIPKSGSNCILKYADMPPK